MRVLTEILLLLLCFKSWGQINLVPNSSFEEYSQCPDAPNQVPYAIGWINPTQGSPDYYNSCYVSSNLSFSVPLNPGGYQEAKTGNAYIGLYAFCFGENELREYVQIKLHQPLLKRKKYYIGYYCVLRKNYSNLATNNIGAFFSKNIVYKTNSFVIDTIPQLINSTINPLTSKTEWMIVSDTIQFNEDSLRYMTIGNFFPDSLTDTVAVSDSIWLVGFKKPYYLIDDVFVIDLDSLTSINELKPLTGKAFIHDGQLLIELEESYKLLEIILTNYTGQIIWQHKGFYTQGQKEYNLPLLSEGLYFVEIRCGGGLLREKVLIYK